MRKIIRCLAVCLCAALLLSGCDMRTVDQLYCLPQRPETDMDLQKVIDRNMSGLSYAVPAYGENRQVTQKVDLDGDGVEECLVFAKDDSEKSLKILIFCQLASGYELMDTIEGQGMAYDFVSYAQMDGHPGMEIIVGRQLSKELGKSLAVYRFSSEISRQLLTVGYSKMVAGDLDGDGLGELVLLGSGEAEDAPGVLSLYRLQDGKIQRTAALDLYGPIQNVERAVIGRLQGGQPAVFITADTAEETLVTDVFAMQKGTITGIYRSEPLQSLSSFFVYPEDVDADGVMEIPALVPMKGSRQYFVHWYSVDTDGNKNTKLYTYMQMAQGWYLTIDGTWLTDLTAAASENSTAFHQLSTGQHLLTVYALTDSDREIVAEEEGYLILFKTDTVIYAAQLSPGAADYGITEESLKLQFHTLRTQLNTDEN